MNLSKKVEILLIYFLSLQIIVTDILLLKVVKFFIVLNREQDCFFTMSLSCQKSMEI